MLINDDSFEELDADLNHINAIYPNYNRHNTSQYYSYTNLNRIYSPNHSNLRLIHYNICSLYPKLDEIKAELSLLEFKFHILCFTESWLTEDTYHLAHFDSYIPFHNLRENKRGGGVSVYVTKDLNATVLSHFTLSNCHIETLFLEIEVSGAKLICGTIYRPPNGDNNIFLSSLQGLVESIDRRNYKEIVITGDFNYDLLKYDVDQPVQMFLNSLHSYALYPLISKPTRVTENSNSLIDNIFITDPVNFVSGTILSSLSDHYPVFCFIDNLSAEQYSAPLSYSYRKINNFTMTSLYNALDRHDFSNVLMCDDVNEAIAKLELILYQIFNEHCPIITKTLSPKNRSKPWITSEILSLVKKRHNLFVLLRAGRVSKLTYNRYRNFVSSRLRYAKINYYEGEFNKYKDDIRKTWKLINNIVKPDNNANNINVEIIIVDNSVLVDKYDIARSFNDYFVNVGQNISQLTNCLPDDHKQYLHGNYTNSFFFSPVSPNEIDKLIYSLKNKQSQLNCIPAKVLKFVSHIISPLLSVIINNSISQGVFPDSLKIARVVVIFKDGDRSLIPNYRPISLLPLLSKIFEKVAHKQLCNYLNSNNVLFNHQYGFRAGRSTENAIVHFLQYLYSNLDDNSYIFSVFLDFKKAFDCINHNILLSKLYHYGVRGVAHDWFRSYLSNRKQYVSIQNCNSECLPISHGVPQGSILGPLLFLVFINDLPQSTQLLKFILFADDSTLSCKFLKSDIDNFHFYINSQLNHVNQWLTANKIAINTNKTKYIVFSNQSSVTLPPIYIGNGLIEPTNSTKFLGVIIDKNLNFHAHVDFIARKLSKNVGILFKLNYLPYSVLRTLYQTLIYPYFLYGIAVYLNCGKTIYNKLVVIQKKCIRAINKLYFCDHTHNYFITNRILKIEDMYFYQVALYIFKTLYCANYDPFLSSCLNYQSQVHNIETRYRHQLSLPIIRTSKSQNSIIFRGVKLYNSLPDKIKESRSVFEFKLNLRKYLFDCYI